MNYARKIGGLMLGTLAASSVQQPGLKPVSAAMLARHGVTVPGKKDALYAPLFDSATYAAAGQTTLNFFSLPIGQGVTTAPGAAGTKTEADTNLTNGNILPRDNSFLCTGVEVQIYPGAASTFGPGGGALADAVIGRFWNDVYAIGKSGVLRLKIGGREYVVDGPLMNFPSTAGLGGVAAVTSTLTAGVATAGEIEYARFVGQAYTLDALWIVPNQNFAVKIEWPAAVATPSTVAARMFIRLRGRFTRSAQ